MTWMKDWRIGVTQIAAQEMRAIGDFFGGIFVPGLIGNALLANCAFATPLVTLTDFAAGDVIWSGRAVLSAFYDRVVDFSTEGLAGGPLPAGTYDIYIDIQEVDLGGGSMQYQAHAKAELANTVDESIYLVVREDVVWDGAAITGNGTDARTSKWGFFDLGELHVGTTSLILLDDLFGRKWDFQQQVVLSGDATVPNGNVIGLLNGGRLYANSGSEIGVDNGASIVIESGGLIEIDAGGTIEVTGHIDVKASGEIDIESTGLLWIESGGLVKFQDADFTGTPAINQFVPAAVPRAGGKFTPGGAPTCDWGFNINGITQNGVGDYRITLKRGIAATSEMLVLVAPYSQGKSAGYQIVNSTTIDVYTYDIIAGAAIDVVFSMVLFGGGQTP